MSNVYGCVDDVVRPLDRLFLAVRVVFWPALASGVVSGLVNVMAVQYSQNHNVQSELLTQNHQTNKQITFHHRRDKKLGHFSLCHPISFAVVRFELPRGTCLFGASRMCEEFHC